jgi:hypothetical protein
MCPFRAGFDMPASFSSWIVERPGSRPTSPKAMANRRGVRAPGCILAAMGFRSLGTRILSPTGPGPWPRPTLLRNAVGAHATTPSMSFTGIAVGTICVNLKPAVR